MVDWIVVTGPESSGKTTLAQDLVQELDGLLVPEYSRIYLEQSGLRYGKDDLELIAAGQRGLEHRALRSATRPIVSDTGLEVLEVWSLERFNCVHPEITNWRDRQVGLYLLCRPDLPWEEDPLRENPFDRDRLFEHYLDMLKAADKPFAVIEGEGNARLQSALDAVHFKP